jgi:hypothetical protein
LQLIGPIFIEPGRCINGGEPILSGFQAGENLLRGDRMPFHVSSLTSGMRGTTAIVVIVIANI